VAAGLTVPDAVPGTLAGPDPTAPASFAVAWLRCTARAVHERRQWLTELDAAIGDGDHGINLDRGFTAIVHDLDAGALPVDEASTLLRAAGRRLLGVVGGASGALYGRAMMAAGARLAERGFGTASEPREVAQAAIEGGIEGIVALGRAVPGDKTMLDALAPALEVLRTAPADLPVDALLAAVATAAEDGAQATISLVARKGRASYLGERSAGHMDPGAASSALMIRCLADAMTAARPPGRKAP
jgi:dihydroxyacetone kinase-like protein